MAKAKKRRRTRTEHQGVVLIQRTLSNGTVTWVARWRDPDNPRKVCQQSLTQLGLKSHEARREWAKKKARERNRRLQEVASGAPRLTGDTLEATLESYFETSGILKRPRTVRTYRRGTRALLAWASANGIQKADQLRDHHLAQFRDWLATQGRQMPKVGGKSGEHTPTDQRRSLASTNTEIKGVKAVVNHLRKQGRLPLVGRDGVERLAIFFVPKEDPEFLSREEVVQVLEAAIKHDALGAGAGARETTYGLAGPFIGYLLLTGCRLGEALTLRWSQVHLDAVDESGAPVGEIRLKPDQVKTNRSRRIDLAVSPALRRLLLALRDEASGGEFVFGGARPLSSGTMGSVRKRLVDGFGAPGFDYRTLRRTCGTWLTNAPGIFGAASAYRSATQLGHSVVIAEKHYVGLVRGVSREATSLEAALGIEGLLAQIEAQVRARRPNEAGEATA